MDQQARIVLRHVVREHFRHMCTEGQFYISDSPSAPLQSLCAALVPGSAASLQAQHLSASGEPQQIDMILEKEGGLCWSDCFSDGAGRYVMRVVKKNPNQQHRVCVSEHFVRNCFVVSRWPVGFRCCVAAGHVPLRGPCKLRQTVRDRA